MPLLKVPDQDRDLHVNIIAKWAKDHGVIFRDWKYLGQVQRSGYSIDTSTPPLRVDDAVAVLTLNPVEYVVRWYGGPWRTVKLLVGADHGLVYYATLAPTESGGEMISPPPADKSS